METWFPFGGDTSSSTSRLLVAVNRSQRAQHREIARRYAAKRKRRTPAGMGALRVRELNRLFDDWYGRMLPDDDSGRLGVMIAAHRLAGTLTGNPAKRIAAWVSLRA